MCVHKILIKPVFLNVFITEKNKYNISTTFIKQTGEIICFSFCEDNTCESFLLVIVYRCYKFQYEQI